MEELTILDIPPVQLKPAVETGLLEETVTQAKEEKQVILHCSVLVPYYGKTTRIWDTTYLCDIGSSKKSKLNAAFNIAIKPEWTNVKPFSKVNFTLIFEPLPGGCNTFYLSEQTEDSGGFIPKTL
jgi:hypothetical protein